MMRKIHLDSCHQHAEFARADAIITTAKSLSFRKHEQMLRQLATRLGLNLLEVSQVMEELHLQSMKQYPFLKGKSSFRLWLTGLLVRKCVFRISSRFFKGEPGLHTIWVSTSTSADLSDIHRPERMPLSYRIVYLLRAYSDFSEAEIAEILNTTPLQVRERMCRALLFMSGTGKDNR